MTSFYPTFLVILFIVALLFWRLARRASHHKQAAIKQITAALEQEGLQDDQKITLQQQLATILVHGNNNKTPVWITIALIIILGGSALYLRIGTPEATAAFAYTPNAASPQKATTDSVPDMQTALAALRKRLSADPENIDNWLLYGRSMMVMKNYDEAVRAYEKARQLQPRNAWVLASLAEAKAFAAGTGTFRGEPEKLLRQALELDPNNQKALWLMGMNAYEREEFQRAETLWTRLLTLVENPSVAEQLRTQIDMARRQQAESANTPTATETQNTEAGNTVSIPLLIDITPEMKDYLGDKPAVLYVYAKPATGMPMPIAVIRGNVSGLPSKFVLSDAHNLQPARKLSQFEQIKLGARISFSGDAMPQPGDIESDEVLTKTTEHNKSITLILNKTR